ncbi:jg482 [Pararge aegeria aegeria]|uniref:Jg482 protein n=1 Tax=Pararge aegeria aegeria TaxID=348720 RepID=A0A8S4QTY1_9NEOP|nr:jg482 [Pararge aegeria aegeria]
MRRRFSLRDFNQGKNKDLSVSYDNNKTILGSTITTVDLNKKTRGNNIEKDNSDPSVEFKVNERNLKKKIHNKKENSHNTLGENIETHIRNSEVGSNVNTDKNKNTGETNETQSIKDKLVTSNNGEKHLQDIVQMGKTAESPGTSSGDATYTVEGSPTHGNEIRDETYPVENKNDNATFQMRNGEDQNYLG